MTTATPPLAAWEMALAGLTQLERKIDALADAQRDMQSQLNDVRSAYTRAAPMSLALALENRVVTLESGATAAILVRLADDHEDRQLLIRLLAVVMALLFGILIMLILLWLRAPL